MGTTRRKRPHECWRVRKGGTGICEEEEEVMWQPLRGGVWRLGIMGKEGDVV